MMDRTLQAVPYFTLDAQATSEINPAWRTQLGLAGPTLAFPLTDTHSVCGVLVVSDARLTANTQAILRRLAPILGVAVSRIVLNDKLASRTAVIRLLQDIPRDFRLSRDEESFACNMAARLKEIVRGAHLCAIYRPLKTPDGPTSGRNFVRVGYHGYPRDGRVRMVQAQTGPGSGLTSYVLTGLSVNVASVEDDARWSRVEADVGEPSARRCAHSWACR